jgi:hypothetical protein
VSDRESEDYKRGFADGVLAAERARTEKVADVQLRCKNALKELNDTVDLLQVFVSVNRVEAEKIRE